MNAPSFARPVSLYRSWPRRVADGWVTTLARVAQAVRDMAVRWRQSRELRRQHEAMLELDEAALRDLGAPPWLMDEAQAQRHAREFDQAVTRLHADLGLRRFY